MEKIWWKNWIPSTSKSVDKLHVHDNSTICRRGWRFLQPLENPHPPALRPARSSARHCCREGASRVEPRERGECSICLLGPDAAAHDLVPVLANTAAVAPDSPPPLPGHAAPAATPHASRARHRSPACVPPPCWPRAPSIQGGLALAARRAAHARPMQKLDRLGRWVGMVGLSGRVVGAGLVWFS